jgi:hypothetical protein
MNIMGCNGFSNSKKASWFCYQQPKFQILKMVSDTFSLLLSPQKSGRFSVSISHAAF